MFRRIEAGLQQACLMQRPLEPKKEAHNYGFATAIHAETVTEKVTGLGKALITSPATFVANRLIQKDNHQIDQENQNIDFCNRVVVKHNQKQCAIATVGIATLIVTGAIVKTMVSLADRYL